MLWAPSHSRPPGSRRCRRPTMVWSAQSRPFPLSILMSGKCKKVEKARLYARASRQWWPPRVVRASICAAGSTSAFRLLRCRAADVGKGGRASQLSEAEDRESVAAAAAAAAAAAVEQRQWRRPVGGAVVDLALLWSWAGAAAQQHGQEAALRCPQRIPHLRERRPPLHRRRRLPVAATRKSVGPRPRATRQAQWHAFSAHAPRAHHAPTSRTPPRTL